MRYSITSLYDACTCNVLGKSSRSASITSFANLYEFSSNLCNLFHVLITRRSKSGSTLSKANIMRSAAMSANLSKFPSTPCVVVKRPFSIHFRRHILRILRLNLSSGDFGLFRALGGLQLSGLQFAVYLSTYVGRDSLLLRT